MFIFNFKVDGNKFSKILFIIMILIILVIFGFGVYNIFFKERINNKLVKVSDTIKSDEIFEITSSNYTNILKAANENIDDYVGCKIHFTGYVYRLIDFNESQFVLARDMLVSNDNNQSLIVGFLCNYDKAKDFEDGTWVDVVGEITKGDFNGDIAIVNVMSINRIDEPEDKFVYPPDDTYIPTSAMF